MYNWYLQWFFLLLFGVHPPVSSCLITVLLMFYSVSCVNFFTFIHIFREYSFCYLVFILRSPPVLLLFLMFYSVSCVNFCTFIHNFRKYSFFYLVFILRSPPVLLLFLMFYSVSCVNFFTFIHIFREIPSFISCPSSGLLLSYCCS